MRSLRSHILPSIASIIFLIIFLRLSLSDAALGLLADGDTGYHIRAGERILDTLSIPNHDIFSFRSPPLPWTAHEWLSEVIMALLHRNFGLTGVVVFFISLIAFTYSLMFKFARREKGNILVALSLMLLVIIASQIHWLARPHVFTLLLIVIWYYLLDAFQYTNANFLYYLPPLMLLWVNLHGGFIIGFVILSIYLIGNIAIGVTTGGDGREFHRSKIKPLGFALAACSLISLINPQGFHIWWFPIRLLSDTYLMDHVHEFLSPNFHQPVVIYFKFLFLLAIAIIASSRDRLNLIELMLIVAFANMTLQAVRFIPIFSIILAPIVIKKLDGMIHNCSGKFMAIVRKKSDGIAATDASSGDYLWPGIAVLIVILLGTGGKISFSFSSNRMPVHAVEFIRQEHLKGNMFNDDEFGDYVIYTTAARYKVFIDGRSDMYGAEGLREYFKVAGFQEGWEKVLEKYDINYLFIRSDSAFSRFLAERREWPLVYSDNVANVYVRNMRGNQFLIDKYKEVTPYVHDFSKSP